MLIHGTAGHLGTSHLLQHAEVVCTQIAQRERGDEPSGDQRDFRHRQWEECDLGVGGRVLGRRGPQWWVCTCAYLRVCAPVAGQGV